MSQNNYGNMHTGMQEGCLNHLVVSLAKMYYQNQRTVVIDIKNQVFYKHMEISGSQK